MRYFLAIFLPPFSVLFCGRPIASFLSLLLTMAALVLAALTGLVTIVLFWPVPVVHAWFVISSHKADVRNQKLIEAIRQR